MKPTNPHGSRGARILHENHPVPFEHTEEGLEQLAARVPSGTPDPAKLDAAADKLIKEITGDDEAGDDIP